MELQASIVDQEKILNRLGICTTDSNMNEEIT